MNPYTFVKEKLLKINGEYVKFYVTTNSQLHKLLANSGAAVIYHESTTGINYLYVGGELIASGYGFESIEIRDKLDEWAREKDKTIKDLHDEDSALWQEIEDTKGDIKKWGEELFVEKENGDVSDTILKPDLNTGDIDVEVSLKMKHIMGLLENITYDRMEIGEILYTITYSNPLAPESNTNYQTFTLLQSQYKALPIGAKLKKVEMLVAIKLNDSGAATQSKLTYYRNDNTDGNQVLTPIIKDVDASTNQDSNYANNIANVLLEGDITDIMNVVYGSELSVSNNEYSSLTSSDQSGLITDECFSYSVNYSTVDTNTQNKYTIKKGNNKIFQDFEIVLGATPVEKYKYYSFSLDKNEYDEPIPAIQNAIKQETISCKKEFDIKNDGDLLTIDGAHIIYVISPSKKENDIQLWKGADSSYKGYHNGSLIMPASDKVRNGLLKVDGTNAAGFELKDLFGTANASGAIIENNEAIRTVWEYADTLSFNIDVTEGMHTVMFTLPATYNVDKVYYTNNQGDHVDISGYFVYCGTQAYNKTTANNNVIRTKDEFVYAITENTSLYYMYSLKGFPKSFTMTVKLKEETVAPTSKLHIDMFSKDTNRTVHQVNFDTEHWFDADMSFKDNNSETFYNKKNAYGLLRDYLEKTNEYL